MTITNPKPASTEQVCAEGCPVCGAAGYVLEAALSDVFFGFPGQWRYNRCPAENCGIAWIAEPLPADQLAAAYARYYTHDAPPPAAIEIMLGRWIAARVGKHGDAFPPLPFLFREAENHLLDSGAITPKADGVALDVGCGAGERLDYLKAIGWGAASGVDPDPVAVSRGQSAGRNVSVGSAETLPIADSCADIIFLHHVVEHLENVRTALQEARRVLKPGGHLVITTPNIDAAGRQQWGALWRGYEAPRHLRIYTLPALRALLEEAGFAIRYARTSGRALPFMNRESERALHEARPRASLSWWHEDRAILAAKRRQQAGVADGEELFLVGQLR